jgi:hypothetical protein
LRVGGRRGDIEECAGRRDALGAVGGGKEPVVADAVETLRQHVQQETPDELVRVKPHRLPAAGAVDAIILPAERNRVVVGCNEAAPGANREWHRLAPEAMKRIFDRKELQMSKRAQDLLCRLGIFCSGCGLVVLLSSPALVRDNGRYAQSPLKPWFDSLKSGKGPCCSDADGCAVSNPDWESKDRHYRVRQEDGLWYDVPEDALITEPNRVGRTMVWPITGSLGRSIRCFMPGAMT